MAVYEHDGCSCVRKTEQHARVSMGGQYPLDIFSAVICLGYKNNVRLEGGSSTIIRP